MFELLAPVIISLSDKTLTLPSGQLIPVAIGGGVTPTPMGSFSVIRKVRNPSLTFYGSCAILLEDGVTGIHGTSDQSSIGKSVSKGCIRVPEWAESEVCRQITFFNTVVIQE